MVSWNYGTWNNGIWERNCLTNLSKGSSAGISGASHCAGTLRKRWRWRQKNLRSSLSCFYAQTTFTKSSESTYSRQECPEFFLILGTYWEENHETVPYKITSWAIFSPFLNFIIPHTPYHQKTRKNKWRKVETYRISLDLLVGWEGGSLVSLPLQPSVERWKGAQTLFTSSASCSVLLPRCENSRLSSLLAAGNVSAARRDGCFRRLTTTNRGCLELVKLGITTFILMIRIFRLHFIEFSQILQSLKCTQHVSAVTLIACSRRQIVERQRKIHEE